MPFFVIFKEFCAEPLITTEIINTQWNIPMMTIAIVAIAIMLGLIAVVVVDMLQEAAGMQQRSSIQR